MKVTIVIVLVLVAIAAARAASTGHAPARPAGAMATVVGSEYERDPDHPAGIHYADCRAGDGSQYRVVVSAGTEYRLRQGQRCPTGPHVPTARQENPALYDQVSAALNAPMPYHGGDANGPCGEWEAADQADADALRVGYARCMAGQGSGR
ncbi:MAG TPA: hypothetical protein VF892_17855 [Pseudonocardiaceae bacterium]